AIKFTWCGSLRPRSRHPSNISDESTFMTKQYTHIQFVGNTPTFRKLPREILRFDSTFFLSHLAHDLLLANRSSVLVLSSVFMKSYQPRTSLRLLQALPSI